PRRWCRRRSNTRQICWVSGSHRRMTPAIFSVYGVWSSPTEQVVTPLTVVQVQRHRLSGGTEPSSCWVRKSGEPAGAPTMIAAPFAVGLGTLQAAHELASQRLPRAAVGWYAPNIWYPSGSELPAVASVETGQEQIISRSFSGLAKPGIRWPRLLSKQNPP